MTRLPKLIRFTTLFAWTAISQPIPAQDLDKAAKALDLISAFAKKNCDVPPLKVSGSSVELTLSGKAELAKLLKKLAELNVELAGKYRASEDIGLLQSDLKTALQDSRTCKLKIFTDLNDKLIPKM